MVRKVVEDELHGEYEHRLLEAKEAMKQQLDLAVTTKASQLQKQMKRQKTAMDEELKT